MTADLKRDPAVLASGALAAPVLAICAAELWRAAHGLPPVPRSGWASVVFPLGLAGFFGAQACLSLYMMRRGLKSMARAVEDLTAARDRYDALYEDLIAYRAALGLAEKAGLGEAPRAPTAH